jgi:cell division FtsZ-interacting protein ZapD
MGEKLERRMSTIKKALMKQGMKLMSDPRVQKLMQDERVMKALMAAMSAPGRAQSFAREHVETIAKAMALATEGEVKDLRRTVRKLEEELARMKAEQRSAGDAPADRPSRPRASGSKR